MAATKIGILLSEVYDRGNPITLFASSVNDGYVAMVTAISKRISEQVIMFRTASMDRLYPGTVIHSLVRGESQRAVYSTKDDRGKWDFFEQGALLPFEEPILYAARLKRDRLNPDIISRYLRNLG